MLSTADAMVAAVTAATTSAEQRSVIAQLDPALVEQLLHAQLSPSADDAQDGGTVFATGMGASPGAATGRVYFDALSALDAFDRGEDVILVCEETSPADEPGMRIAEGIVTAKGGLTSHAAVVARGLGVPAVCGAETLVFADGSITSGGVTLHAGDEITVDGSGGQVLAGSSGLASDGPPAELLTALGWADDVRLGSDRRVEVWANADTGEDAAVARGFGAQGIGLCRTEHMFLGERLPLIQRFLVADSDAEEQSALTALHDVQVADFTALLEAMDGLPVTVRLLDAPVHEFLHGHPDAEQWHEHNPMLGTRGVRLAVVRPALYRTQVRALLDARAARVAAGGDPRVDILIPLVADVAELVHVRTWITEEIGTADNVAVGVMIETPRAALTAGELVGHSDFFSFGTNDLTQMTFGFSRDDVERRVLSAYRASGVMPNNPFQHVDQAGVGALVQQAITAARNVRDDFKIGICGEHGGDPESIAFFVHAGVDYVSCSPYRVPVARLAVAQALLDQSA